MVYYADKQTAKRNYGQSQQFLYDNSPLYMSIHGRDSDGQTLLFPTIRYFNQLKLQSVVEPETSMTQILLTDSPKLYTFSKDHKFYSYSAILEDTVLSGIQQTTQKRTGTGYKEFLDFYENFASTDSCAEKNLLLRMSYDGTIVYGSITEMDASQNAMEPQIYTLSFLVHVISDISL